MQKFISVARMAGEAYSPAVEILAIRAFPWNLQKIAWQIGKAFVLGHPTLRQRRYSLVAQR
jgi:hypothetical protein